MQFVFQGTLDELKDLIRKKACALHRSIVVYHNDPALLQIGFLRLGHSGGRFFAAKVSVENNRIILDGEIKNLTTRIPDADTRSFFQKLRDTLFGLTVLYVFLALIPWAVWSIFRIPHPWIAFLIPALVLLTLQLPPLFHRGERTFDAEDSSFLRFMTMVTTGEITIPSNSQELYSMLLHTPGLHSFPKIKDNVITWELYENVFVEAAVSEHDTLIDIIHKSTFLGSYMHWHPDREEIYEELCALGKKGNILVLRKTLGGSETYYIGESDKYPFSPTKKRHWGKLIYLKQK